MRRSARRGIFIGRDNRGSWGSGKSPAFNAKSRESVFSWDAHLAALASMAPLCEGALEAPANSA